MKKVMIEEKRSLLFVIIIIFIFHSSYISNGFTWLDNGDILAGRTIYALTDWKGILLSSFGSTSFYRPLVTVINSLDYAVYGKLSFGYHFTNVILHLIATCSVYFFASSYFKVSNKVALLASLIFGLHTLSWLPVGSISYRSEIMVTIFALLSVYSHIKTRLGNGYQIFTYVFIVLALLSKESALVWIPLLIFVWEVSEKGSLRINLNNFHLKEIFIIIFFLMLRFSLFPLKTSSQLNSTSLINTIGIRLQVIYSQFLHLISPFKPALSDSLQIKTLFRFEIFAVISIAVIAVAVIIKYKFNSVIPKAIIFIAIALVPALNIIHLPRINSPHYAYFASTGIALLIAFLFYHTKSNTVKVFITLWILLSAVITFKSGFQFKNDLTLFLSEVEHDNNFLEGHFYLADYYFKNNDLQNAEVHYKFSQKENEGVYAYVDRYSSTLNMAGVKLGLGKTQEAELLLQDLLNTEKGKHDENVAYNLGLVHFTQEDYEGAIEVLEERGDWTNVEPLFLLSKSYLVLNMTKEAVNTLEKSLEFMDGDRKRDIKSLIEEIKKDDI